MFLNLILFSIASTYAADLQLEYRELYWRLTVLNSPSHPILQEIGVSQRKLATRMHKNRMTREKIINSHRAAQKQVHRYERRIRLEQNPIRRRHILRQIRVLRNVSVIRQNRLRGIESKIRKIVQMRESLRQRLADYASELIELFERLVEMETLLEV